MLYSWLTAEKIYVNRNMENGSMYPRLINCTVKWYVSDRLIRYILFGMVYFGELWQFEQLFIYVNANGGEKETVNASVTGRNNL